MKKPVTGSHSGTGWWLVQRVSAVVMLVVGAALFVLFLLAAPFDHELWKAMFASMGIRILVWLMVAGICLHAWIGMRDVLMDYVKPIVLRLAMNVLFILMFASSVLWTTVILWGPHG